MGPRPTSGTQHVSAPDEDDIGKGKWRQSVESYRPVKETGSEESTCATKRDKESSTLEDRISIAAPPLNCF